ncbi:MAG: magnesium/cobalt transporter CorA [Thermodesulfobacteriota bacterium]|nr:magnesium/cobalt transporter CorA [Thermodesulfobacteriota bacterium]
MRNHTQGKPMAVTSARRHSEKLGMPPGSLVFVGEQRRDRIAITLADFGSGHLEQAAVDIPEACLEYRRRPSITWVDVSGLHEPDKVERLGKCFDIHPLIMEDILNTTQRPKIELFENMVFAVLKAFWLDEARQVIAVEHVSLILGERFVLSFQEGGKDVFAPVRERLQNPRGRIRTMGADYLFYTLMDTIVDHCFGVLEEMGERIEELEEALLESLDQEMLSEIHRLKRETLFLRKSLWPLREVVGRMDRGESRLFQEATRPYIRDLYDHTLQVVDTLENYREMSSALLEVYLTNVSNRTNEVMKVLTVIATLFIPITFLAGVYGMNFDYMPELKWRWGYPAVWVVMIAMGAGMLGYFKSRKWL